MRFKNNGESLKIRVGKYPYSWITMKNGETRDLPEEIGKRYNLEVVKKSSKKLLVTESKIGNVKVETKQVKKRKPRVKK
jgi:hypothetical protein